MRLLTQDDFIESYCKLKQRGPAFLRSKLNINPTKRTQSSFDDAKLETANWWIIPEVRQRWNKIITSTPNIIYEDYFVERHLNGRDNLKMISLGSGICSHEIALAKHAQFKKISCNDIAGQLLLQARQNALEEGLDNMEFNKQKTESIRWSKGEYDIFMFHQSLHHFSKVDRLLQNIAQSLEPEGLLLLHEYVGPNRLIWTRAQLNKSNELLHRIPEKFRIRFKTDMVKDRITGPGLMRMLISDPSEAVEAERIRPALKKYFEAKEEKELGGNLLCLVLKDIAHHFLNPDEEKKAILKMLFEEEDKFIKTHPSDMLFGVYKAKAG